MLTQFLHFLVELLTLAAYIVIVLFVVVVGWFLGKDDHPADDQEHEH